MLQEVLKMDWDTIQQSDYRYKSNIFKHVVQIKGSEFGEPSISIMLIYYNVYTGMPMLAVARMKQRGAELPDVEGYKKTREDGNEEQMCYTDYTFVAEAIMEALS